MKRILLTLGLIYSLSATLQAQNAAYEKTMAELVAQIQTTDFQTSLQPVTNKMQRVASAETKEWLPNYWVAYCYSIDSFKKTEAGEKDLMLDQAEAFLATAEKLSPNNDEIEVLKAQVASARMAVDPMSRWQTYGAKFQQALDASTALNAENPRIYYLQGTSVFYTPENFGGGKSKAKPLFEKAIEKFNTFESKSDMHPKWGMAEAQYFLSQCQ